VTIGSQGELVIVEFPDMYALNAWYNSPEYQPLISWADALQVCRSQGHTPIDRTCSLKEL
jgi:uncharacterized protein (DUF1330 family)